LGSNFENEFIITFHFLDPVVDVFRMLEIAVDVEFGTKETGIQATSMFGD
jgi:hypothetical protein